MRTTCCAGRSGISAGFLRGEVLRHVRTAEPPQTGERRVHLEREGTTAYLKLAYPRARGD